MCIQGFSETSLNDQLLSGPDFTELMFNHMHASISTFFF